jgi:AP-1 complex subunit gamma-1
MTTLCDFSKICQIIDTFGSHLHIELQQRGVEFSQLFRKYEHLRPALLERMPPLETARPTGANNPAAMTNGETSEDLDATGDEGNLLVDGRKGLGESEAHDSVSTFTSRFTLSHTMGLE